MAEEGALTLDELRERLGADSVEAVEAPPMRKICIETDGNSIRVVKNESAGTLEFVMILRSILQQYGVGPE